MRHIVAALAASLIAAVASASTPDAEAFAIRRAELRAEVAMQALSDRYTALWGRLDATSKKAFSARERAWLNDGRREEQRACAAQRPAVAAALAQAVCLAEVTEHRLATLAGNTLALQASR